jgi:hypothetical protein
MTQPTSNLDEQPTVEELAGMDSEVLALMLTLLQRSNQEANHITSQLADAYQRDFYQARAELEVIRSQVERLFENGTMPTPDAVLRAIYYPSRAAVAERVARFENGEF